MMKRHQFWNVNEHINVHESSRWKMTVKPQLEAIYPMSYQNLTTTTVMTVSSRPEDVQAIVSGLAANPSAVATLADSQQVVSLANLTALSSQSQMGKLTPSTLTITIHSTEAIYY